jgi:hypothetical protein
MCDAMAMVVCVHVASHHQKTSKKKPSKKKQER